MTFAHFNRRLHLYLGLALLPWFLIYGLSSIPWAHTQYFQARDAAKGLPLFTLRSEHAFDEPAPEDPKELRAFAAALLEEVGVRKPNFFVSRMNPTTLNIIAYSFLENTRVRYHIDQKKVTVEDRRFRVDQFLAGMHARGGFVQESAVADSWGIVVDLFCVGVLVWIASGLYMWWGIPGHRGWGWVAIVSGAASFALFALRL